MEDSAIRMSCHYHTAALVALFFAYQAVVNRLPSSDVPLDETRRRDAYSNGINTTDTSTDIQNDEEEGSWLGRGVITEVIAGVLDWLITAFVGLVADRMERKNSTSYEGSFIS